MCPSRVDGSASSEIECAGGIRRVTEDEDGIGGRGETDRGGTRAGLDTRGGVLLQIMVRQQVEVSENMPNHIPC
jgi:hypothetical protein